MIILGRPTYRQPPAQPGGGPGTHFTGTYRQSILIEGEVWITRGLWMGGGIVWERYLALGLGMGLVGVLSGWATVVNGWQAFPVGKLGVHCGLLGRFMIG
jgi:hypothetical protein